MYIFQLKTEPLGVVRDSVDGIGVELNAIQRNQFQAILRTNIDAAAAEHAIGAIRFAAFKNRVDVALQAALRFGHGFLLGIHEFDFGHTCAAVQRQHGDGLTLEVHVVHRHLPAVQDVHFDLRLGMLGAANVFVNANRRALSIADAVDNQPRTKGAVTAGEDAGRGGHQSFAMYVNQSARRHLYAIIRKQEVEIGCLADRKNDGVALKLGFAVLVENGTEAVVLVEHTHRLQAFQADNFAVAPEHAIGSEPGMHDDAFGLRLFDLLQRGRHFMTLLKAHQADLTSAHAQR